MHIRFKMLYPKNLKNRLLGFRSSRKTDFSDSLGIAIFYLVISIIFISKEHEKSGICQGSTLNLHQAKPVPSRAT